MRWPGTQFRIVDSTADFRVSLDQSAFLPAAVGLPYHAPDGDEFRNVTLNNPSGDAIIATLYAGSLYMGDERRRLSGNINMTLLFTAASSGQFLKTHAQDETAARLKSVSFPFQKAIILAKKSLAGTNNVGNVRLAVSGVPDEQPLTLEPGDEITLEAPFGQYWDFHDWFLSVDNDNDGVVVIFSGNDLIIDPRPHPWPPFPPFDPDPPDVPDPPPDPPVTPARWLLTPTLYYDFRGNSLDDLIQGQPLVPDGAYGAFVDGKINAALQLTTSPSVQTFRAVSGSVTPFFARTSGDICVGYWFKVDGALPAPGITALTLLSYIQFNASNVTQDFLIVELENALLRLRVGSESLGQTVSQAYADGNWHLLLLHATGSRVRLLVDNVVRFDRAIGVLTLQPKGTLKFFKQTASCSLTIDEFFFYQNAVVPDAIFDFLWNGGAGRTYP